MREDKEAPQMKLIYNITRTIAVVKSRGSNIKNFQLDLLALPIMKIQIIF